MSRMPKYEKIRNRRLFERHKHEPKPNKLWTFVNSGIFLWLLSATLLTVGGGYIANHQQCMRDADQIIERRSRLSLEILSRNASFASRVEGDKTLRPPFGPDKQGSVYADLANVSYSEVQRELWRLNEQIHKEELPDKEMQQAQYRWLNFNSKRADREYEKYREAPPSSSTTGDALRFLKTTVELQSLYDQFDRDLDILAYNYEPNCTIMNTMFRALGFKPSIVRASISPMFDLGDTRTILKEDVDDIEQRQRREK
jgi:hypothetical protein